MAQAKERMKARAAKAWQCQVNYAVNVATLSSFIVAAFILSFHSFLAKRFVQ
jgi:hypothetical protein